MSGIVSTALQPVSCSARTWPAPRVVSQCMASCNFDNPCIGAAGLTQGLPVAIYPISCSADDPGKAASIIDCLLFPKWRFENLKFNLQSLLAVRPPGISADEANATFQIVRDNPAYKQVWSSILQGTGDIAFQMIPGVDMGFVARCRGILAKGKACQDWINAVADLVWQALDATNIQLPWLLGGPAPTGPADYTTRLPSADPRIWPTFNATLRAMSVTSGRIVWPQFFWRGDIALIGFRATRGVLLRPPFAPAQFGQVADADRTGPRSSNFGYPASTDFPSALIGAMSAVDPLPTPWLGGMSARANPAYYATSERWARTYFAQCNYGRFWGGTVKLNGVDELAFYPSVQLLMDLWAAIGRDIAIVPYESFVVTGVQAWATTMQSWAAGGYINKTPAQFAETAQAAATTASRIATGSALSAGGGIAALAASAINPVAGAVVGVLAAAMAGITDLLFQLGAAAVGGWQCPPPLVKRTAGGLCDFTQILGPGAVERVAAQASNVVAHAQATLQAQQQQAADARSAETKRKLMPWLFGGGIVAALGAGYYLLKGK